jgi:Flp pilus assembly protein TadD
MSEGDWNGARPLLAAAVKLRPKDSSMAATLVLARTALGEFAELEPELRTAFDREPGNFIAANELCSLLVAEGRLDDAARVVSGFAAAVQRQKAANAASIAAILRRRYLYMAGNFKELEKAAGGPDPAARNDLFYALVEQGRLDDAAKLHPPDEAGVADPYHFLTMSIAWRLKGDSQVAGKWLDRALAVFDAGDADWRRAASLLRRTVEPGATEINAVVQAPSSKAILLAALAQLRPERRAELAAAARRVNQTRTYPYHLVTRAVAEKTGE